MAVYKNMIYITVWKQLILGEGDSFILFLYLFQLCSSLNSQLLSPYLVSSQVCQRCSCFSFFFTFSVSLLYRYFNSCQLYSNQCMIPCYFKSFSLQFLSFHSTFVMNGCGGVRPVTCKFTSFWYILPCDWVTCARDTKSSERERERRQEERERSK